MYNTIYTQYSLYSHSGPQPGPKGKDKRLKGQTTDLYLLARHQEAHQHQFKGWRELSRQGTCYISMHRVPHHLHTARHKVTSVIPALARQAQEDPRSWLACKSSRLKEETPSKNKVDWLARRFWIKARSATPDDLRTHTVEN